MFHFFNCVRAKYPFLNVEIRHILHDHRTPETGLTISEIRAAYKERTENTYPLSKKSSIINTEFLLTIPYVAGYCDENGTLFFYILR